MFDVPHVELDPLRPRKCVAAGDLGPAGNARGNFEAPALKIIVLLDLVAEGWARPNDAHVTADDVPELWQLVEGPPAQEGPDPRNPLV